MTGWITTTTGTSVSTLHNGPICPTCRRGYIGQHTCNPDDLRRMVDDLNRRIAVLEAEAPRPENTYARTCPCMPALGGSGVCGCILGGYTIT